MALTTRKNAATKALQAIMAAEKKTDLNILAEWEYACNTNVNRGRVVSQQDIHNMYERGNRYDYNSAEHGATKLVHMNNAETGAAFKYIVIKRHMKNGYLPELRNDKATGNQLIDEINCWVEYAERPESDYLCPILKYFTSKSDKVTATSEKMQYNVVIIAQRAVYVSDLRSACRKAEKLNAEHGYTSECAIDRFNDMKAFADSQNWRDAVYNDGNSGVIFDYAKGCYKAVFIDYAL